MNGGAVDSSGQGRNGTINGATLTVGQNGEANGAYAFSTTAVNGINTGYTFPYDTLSVSAWIKWAGTSVSSFGSIVSNARDCCATYNGVHIQVNRSNSYIHGKFWYGSSNSSISYGTAPVGEWTHVAMTYNGATKALYVNGQLVDSGSFTQVLGTPAYTVQIGRGGWSNSYSFGGDMDDVRIYDYGLSADTVKAIYDMGAL